MRNKNEQRSSNPHRRRDYLRELNNHPHSSVSGQKMGQTSARNYNAYAESSSYHASDRTRRRRESAHFERYASEGNRFVHEVAEALGTENHAMALRITKVALHLLRDRMTPDEAVEFAQGLPTMLKAVYFEGYDLSKKPLIMRRAHDLIAYIRNKDRFAFVRDFPNDDAVLDGLVAVISVLNRHLDPGQMNQIKHLFNLEIRNLIEESS